MSEPNDLQVAKVIAQKTKTYVDTNISAETNRALAAETRLEAIIPKTATLEEVKAVLEEIFV